MATEYVVVLIAIALAAVIIVAGYGRNVGERVGAAGEAVDSLGERRDATSGGPGTGASTGGSRTGGETAPATASRDAGSESRDGETSPSGSGSADPIGSGLGGSRQTAIFGIAVVTVVLLAAVRFSQSFRRITDARREAAAEARRQESERARQQEKPVSRDLSEDTLSVERRSILGTREGTDDEGQGRA